MEMVISERQGAVAVLTLNNPAQYNALAWQLLRDLNAALDAALEDTDVRAILITGAGKGFCAGAQFGGDTFEQGGKIADAMRDLVNPVIEKMRASRKPVVTAVNGPAAGAGVALHPEQGAVGVADGHHDAGAARPFYMEFAKRNGPAGAVLLHAGADIGWGAIVVSLAEQGRELVRGAGHTDLHAG